MNSSCFQFPPITTRPTLHSFPQTSSFLLLRPFNVYTAQKEPPLLAKPPSTQSVLLAIVHLTPQRSHLQASASYTLR